MLALSLTVSYSLSPLRSVQLLHKKFVACLRLCLRAPFEEIKLLRRMKGFRSEDLEEEKLSHQHELRFFQLGSLLNDVGLLPNLAAVDGRFPFDELHKLKWPILENKDTNDTDDDDDDKVDDQDSDAGDEDFSGGKGEDTIDLED
ncbi:hypothetical protein FNV43_RR15007 [Rhamnella rubrinervis]|uniref:Uncharacterized protein n=1 Tax=Rhamnella rubrinervis TaxID=2594499 RepID=A0A8K0EC85_9ROSA|nr:hypothetical protein FNV43_RR15007 [Rhamnella rubrinervis]